MMTLQQQTRIAVHVVIDDAPSNIDALIAVLTELIQLLIGFGRLATETIHVIYDIVDGVTITAKIWSIWFQAFSFGLGVKI